MCTRKPQSYEVTVQYDTERDTHYCLSFWAIFCTFTPLTTRKIKILKKWKKHLDMSSFYTCMSKITIIWCMLPEIWSVTDKIFVILGYFSLLPHYWPRKLRFKKMYKTPGDITFFHISTINEDHMTHGSWDIR